MLCRVQSLKEGGIAAGKGLLLSGDQLVLVGTKILEFEFQRGVNENTHPPVSHID